jgi:hypothetical protein
VKVRETCGCGCQVAASGDDPAVLAEVLVQWRAAHPCDRREAVERDVVAGAHLEPTLPPLDSATIPTGFAPAGTAPDPAVPGPRTAT